MENKKQTKNKKIYFFVKLGFFRLNWEKTYLFGIGNWAEFGPQNRVIESQIEGLLVLAFPPAESLCCIREQDTISTA